TAHSDEILKQAGFDFSNDMPLLGVGEVLEESQRWEEATALYETYTRLFPRIVVAWNRLGKCYKQKGENGKSPELLDSIRSPAQRQQPGRGVAEGKVNR